MRARFLIPLVLFLVPAAVMAQGRGGRWLGRQVPQMQMRGPGAGMEGGPAQMLLDRREALNLTDEQVSRLEQLAAEWKAAHEPLRADMEQLRQERAQLNTEQRERMQALRETARAAGENARQGIEGVLTDEQRQLLRNRAGMMRRGRGGPALRGGGLGLGAGRARLGPGARAWRGPQAFGPGWQAAPRWWQAPAPVAPGPFGRWRWL